MAVRVSKTDFEEKVLKEKLTGSGGFLFRFLRGV